ncbi:MAG: type II toxin-antitoxin system YoeB family toxin [Cyanobium sp.]
MPAAERLAWTPAAWEDSLDWQGQDPRQLKRINQLIQACLRDAFGGIGSSTGWRGTSLCSWPAVTTPAERSEVDTLCVSVDGAARLPGT